MFAVSESATSPRKMPAHTLDIITQLIDFASLIRKSDLSI